MPGQVVISNDARARHNLFSSRPAFYLMPAPKKKTSPSESKTVWRKYLILILNFIITFLLSRFTIPGGISPAGAAFLIASLCRQFNLATLIFILGGAFLGTFSVKGLENAGGGDCYVGDGQRRKNQGFPWFQSYGFLLISFS